MKFWPLKYFWSLIRGITTGGLPAFLIAGGEEIYTFGGDFNKLFLLCLAFLHPYWFLLMVDEIIFDKNKHDRNIRVILFVLGYSLIFLLAFLVAFIDVKFGK